MEGSCANEYILTPTLNQSQPTKLKCEHIKTIDTGLCSFQHKMSILYGGEWSPLRYQLGNDDPKSSCLYDTHMRTLMRHKRNYTSDSIDVRRPRVYLRPTVTAFIVHSFCTQTVKNRTIENALQDLLYYGRKQNITVVNLFSVFL